MGGGGQLFPLPDSVHNDLQKLDSRGGWKRKQQEKVDDWVKTVPDDVLRMTELCWVWAAKCQRYWAPATVVAVWLEPRPVTGPMVWGWVNKSCMHGHEFCTQELSHPFWQALVWRYLEEGKHLSDSQQRSSMTPQNPNCYAKKKDTFRVPTYNTYAI